MTIYQVGLWLTRDPEKVRLVIEGGHSETASPEDWVTKALAFLQRIGWPGDAKRLSDLLLKLAKVATSGVYLAVDVSSTTGPKLGLESYVQAMSSVAAIEEHQKEWIRFLDWLLEEGWVTPEKYQAHLDYIGMGKKARIPFRRRDCGCKYRRRVAFYHVSLCVLGACLRLRTRASLRPRSTAPRRATPRW